MLLAETNQILRRQPVIREVLRGQAEVEDIEQLGLPKSTVSTMSLGPGEAIRAQRGGAMLRLSPCSVFSQAKRLVAANCQIAR